MKITFITLFPEIFPTLLNFSILKRAQAKGLVEFEVVNLREFGEGVHKIVDDRPYAGGAGMLLRADILTKALKSVIGSQLVSSSKTKTQKRTNELTNNQLTILTSASGKSYKQSMAREFSKLDHIIIICGHYEGVDQRFIDKYVDEEISTGDYVLTGGELPALTIADSIVRLIPKVLEKDEATIEESFEDGILEYPHYTRPDDFEGMKVPEILKNGNHAEIKKWRQEKALEKTKKVRPDLLKN